MNETEFADCAQLYAAYRGARATELEGLELRRLIANGPAERAMDAIRGAAEAKGWLTLADVSQRYATLRAADVASEAERIAAEKRMASVAAERPGYPVAEGQPTGAYLFAIVAIGAPDARTGVMAAADRARARFASAGYILEAHGEQIMAAMRKTDRPALASQYGCDAVEAIEHRLGPWATRPAKDYVRAVSTRLAFDPEKETP